MENRVTVEGIVDNVIFTNHENGYTVLRLWTDDNDAITVVGCIPDLGCGESLTVTGIWTNHPSYGEQLTAESVERRLPETEENIRIYLSSGIIKGIRAATASSIVNKFGIDALYILENEPEKLQIIKGITAKKAQEMHKAFHGILSLRNILEFLSRFDLPVHLAAMIYKAYGDKAIETIKSNPYLLANERFGVDFSHADEIAISIGFGGDAACRLEAALKYELAYNMGNGHVFLPREKLILATEALIGVPQEFLEVALDNLIELGTVVEEPIANVQACYLRKMYEAETSVCRKIKALLSENWETGKNVDKIISEIEKEQNITYAAEQRKAVAKAAVSGVMLLTGGPGTGKTTSTKGILHLLERMGLNVLLLAPTGRAAKRIGELCQRDAQTIHRALGMNFNELTGEYHFNKNAKEPLETDAVIVDEMSMVDLQLMHALLSAMRPGCRLIMVGDPYQLPSVGAGNVLADLLKSGCIETVSLTEIFRQSESSAIIRNAHAVNQGMPPDLSNTQNDFFFLGRRNPERVVSTIVELCKDRLPNKMGIPSSHIQVLSPTRKGECGTIYLNRALQQALNPPSRDKHEKNWGDLIFREGDRVMQVKNDYDILWQKDDGTMDAGIFNGDVGIIEEIDPTGEMITIRFDDRTCIYTPELLSELDMAYAVTVHKAQGSEYQAVILSTYAVSPSLMVRGVLYTAITRAKELLVLVGDENIPAQMTANDKQQRRYSGLKRRLMEDA